jgi:divalent metal cation (Fe/Co/Zn/Cd) transporter
VTISLKAVAWRLTGSVGFLSDAAESVVNLAAALIALWALTVADRPPSPTHDFGYSKAEYFASGAEGFLILAAAAGIVIAAWERWQNPTPIRDPWIGIAIAAAVAANIVRTGWKLVRETGMGLLDTAIPEADRRRVTAALTPFQEQGILFHAIWTRVAGRRRFVAMHVLAPGSWTIQKGHDLCEEIEAAVRRELPETHVFTHLEPREDPVSWEDRKLDRV